MTSLPPSSWFDGVRRAATDHVAFLGEPRFVPGYRALECKGTLVQSRPRYVKKHAKPATFDLIAEELSPEARELFLRPPIAFTWSPYIHVLEIDYAIFRHMMGSSTSMMRDFGADIAIHDLPTIYKALLRLGSPRWLVSKIELAYGAYLRPGVVKSVVEERSAVVTLSGVVWPIYMCEHGFSGWFRAACAITGGENVAVVHPSCRHRGDSECTWHIGWRG